MTTATVVEGDKLRISLSSPTLLLVLATVITTVSTGTWWLAAQQRGIDAASQQAVQNSKDIAELRKITTDMAALAASASTSQAMSGQQYANMKDDFIDLRDRVKALEVRRP